MNRFRNKIISSIVTAFFLANECAFAAPVSQLWEATNAQDQARHLAWAKSVLPEIPDSIASIEDAWKGSGKTVILIQDAHTNDSAQLNQAQLLDFLFTHKKNLAPYVFLEAGYGDESLTFLKKYAPPAKQTEAARSFVIQAKLQASEYLSLTTDHPVTLWGVEDMALYAQSVELYRQVVEKRERFKSYLSKVESTIEVLKPILLNRSLLSFDAKYQRYVSGELSVTDYFDFLSEKSKKLNISIDLPHIKSLGRIKDLESKIDFEKASEEERAAVLSLPDADQKLFTNRLLRTDKINRTMQRSAFKTLRGKLSDLSHYPNLARYMDYIEKSDDLDFAKLFEEEKLLETAVVESLVTQEDERSLVQASRNVHSLKKLFDLQMNPDDYRNYVLAKKDFDIASITGFLNRKIMDLKANYHKALFLEKGYEDVVKRCEEFYELTYGRDRAFLDNLTRKYDGPDASILVAGGYHAINLKYLLRQRGISYISVIPNVSQETDMKRYESIILNQKITFSPASVNLPAAMHTNMPLRMLWRGAFGGSTGETWANRIATSPAMRNQVLGEIEAKEAEFAASYADTSKGMPVQAARMSTVPTPEPEATTPLSTPSAASAITLAIESRNLPDEEKIALKAILERGEVPQHNVLAAVHTGSEFNILPTTVLALSQKHNITIGQTQDALALSSLYDRDLGRVLNWIKLPSAIRSIDPEIPRRYRLQVIKAIWETQTQDQRQDSILETAKIMEFIAEHTADAEGKIQILTFPKIFALAEAIGDVDGALDVMTLILETPYHVAESQPYSSRWSGRRLFPQTRRYYQILRLIQENGGLTFNVEEVLSTSPEEETDEDERPRAARMSTVPTPEPETTTPPSAASAITLAIESRNLPDEEKIALKAILERGEVPAHTIVVAMHTGAEFNLLPTQVLALSQKHSITIGQTQDILALSNLYGRELQRVIRLVKESSAIRSIDSDTPRSHRKEIITAIWRAQTQDQHQDSISDTAKVMEFIEESRQDLERGVEILTPPKIFALAELIGDVDGALEVMKLILETPLHVVEQGEYSKKTRKRLYPYTRRLKQIMTLLEENGGLTFNVEEVLSTSPEEETDEDERGPGGARMSKSYERNLLTEIETSAMSAGLKETYRKLLAISPALAEWLFASDAQESAADILHYVENGLPFWKAHIIVSEMTARGGTVQELNQKLVDVELRLKNNKIISLADGFDYEDTVRSLIKRDFTFESLEELHAASKALDVPAFKIKLFLERYKLSLKQFKNLFDSTRVKSAAYNGYSLGPVSHQYIPEMMRRLVLAQGLATGYDFETTSTQMRLVDPSGKLQRLRIKTYKVMFLNEFIRDIAIKNGNRYDEYCAALYFPDIKLLFIDNLILERFMNGDAAASSKSLFLDKLLSGDSASAGNIEMLFLGDTLSSSAKSTKNFYHAADPDLGLRFRRTAAWLKRPGKEQAVAISTSKPVGRLRLKPGDKKDPEDKKDAKDKTPADPLIAFMETHRLPKQKMVRGLNAAYTVVRDYFGIDEANSSILRMEIAVNLQTPVTFRNGILRIDASVLKLTAEEIRTLLVFSLRHMNMEQSFVKSNRIVREMSAYYQNLLQLLSLDPEAFHTQLIEAYKKLGAEGWDTGTMENLLRASKEVQKKQALSFFRHSTSSDLRYRSDMMRSVRKSLIESVAKPASALLLQIQSGISDENPTPKPHWSPDTGYWLPTLAESRLLKFVYPQIADTEAYELLTANLNFLQAMRDLGWDYGLTSLVIYDRHTALKDLSSGIRSQLYRMTQQASKRGLLASHLLNAMIALESFLNLIDLHSLRDFFAYFSKDERLVVLSGLFNLHEHLYPARRESAVPGEELLPASKINAMIDSSSNLRDSGKFRRDLLEWTVVLDADVPTISQHLPEAYRLKAEPDRIARALGGLMRIFLKRWALSLAAGLDPAQNLSMSDRTRIVDLVDRFPDIFALAAMEAETEALNGNEGLLRAVLLLRAHLKDTGSVEFIDRTLRLIDDNYANIDVTVGGQAQRSLGIHDIAFFWLTAVADSAQIQERAMVRLNHAVQYARGGAAGSGETIFQSLRAGARPADYPSLLRDLLYNDIFKTLPSMAERHAKYLMEILTRDAAEQRRRAVQLIIASEADLHTVLKEASRINAPIKNFLISELPEQWIAENMRGLSKEDAWRMMSGLDPKLVARITQQMNARPQARSLQNRRVYEDAIKAFPGEIPNLALGGEMQNHYAVLGVPRDVTAKDLQESYNRLSHIFHPDMYSSENPSAVEEAVVVFKNIAVAHEVLSDPKKLKEYRSQISERAEYFPKKPWFKNIPKGEDAAPLVSLSTEPLPKNRSLITVPSPLEIFFKNLRSREGSANYYELAVELKGIFPRLWDVDASTLLTLHDILKTHPSESAETRLVVDSANYIVEKQGLQIRQFLKHPEEEVRLAAANMILVSRTNRHRWVVNVAVTLLRDVSPKVREKGIDIFMEMIRSSALTKSNAASILIMAISEEKDPAVIKMLRSGVDAIEALQVTPGAARLARSKDDRLGVSAFLVGISSSHAADILDDQNRIAIGREDAVFHIKATRQGARLSLSLLFEGETVARIGNVSAARAAFQRLGTSERKELTAAGADSVLRAAARRVEEVLPPADYSASKGYVEIDFSQLASAFAAANLNDGEIESAVRLIFEHTARESGKFYLSHADDGFFKNRGTLDVLQMASELRYARAEKGEITTTRPESGVISKLFFDDGRQENRELLANEVITRTAGFIDGQIPDFAAAFRIAQEQASFYGNYLQNGRIADAQTVVLGLQNSRLLSALRSLSVDGKSIQAGQAHRLMTSISLDRDEVRKILIRPLFKFLNDRLTALRYMLQVESAA